MGSVPNPPSGNVIIVVQWLMSSEHELIKNAVIHLSIALVRKLKLVARLHTCKHEFLKKMRNNNFK